MTEDISATRLGDEVYISYPKGMDNNSAVENVVHGLVDGRGAAEMLGLGVKGQRRFSVWLAKRAHATAHDVPLTPLLALLPKPAGRLNGGAVFTTESIESFGIAAASYIGATGYRPAQPKVTPAEAARVEEEAPEAEDVPNDFYFESEPSAAPEATPTPRKKNTLHDLGDLEEF